MYQTSLFVDVKATADKKLILEMFFKDWVDSICNSEVRYYKLEFDTIRLDFDNPEDAVAVKLRGVPAEFQRYLEIVN